MEGCEISILLPVFNAGRFLAPLLDSIILQTWQNFELLIFDDGSTDHSWDVILQFSKRDRRIRPQRADVNRGQEFALKKISAQCRGRLIMFCDQDDVWEPEKVRRLVDGIGECSMAYGTSPLIDADGKSLERTLFDAVGPPIEGKDCLELLFRNTASGHALLMKRTNLCESAFLPSIANVLFDWRLAAAASYSGGLKFVPAA